MDSTEYRKRFQDKSPAEQVKTLYRQGVPVRMFDPLRHKWFSPIQDTVRRKSGSKLSLSEIHKYIQSLTPQQRREAKEQRQHIRERANEIRTALGNKHSLSFYYKSVQLGYAARARDNLVYHNFFTNESPPK